MGTYAHVITRNRNTKTPERVACLSAATRSLPVLCDSTAVNITLGCASSSTLAVHSGHCTNRSDCVLRSPAEIIVWISGLPRTKVQTWLFCHDLYRTLTICGVFHYLVKAGWVVDTWVALDPPSVFIFRRGTATLICCDVLNYWIASERDYLLAASLPAPDYDPSRAGIEESAEYARLLLLATEHAVTTWIRLAHDEDLGHWGCTAGSIAWSAWRHSGMGCAVHVHGDKLTTKLERGSYFGGRADCHRIGQVTGPINHVDVNSLYPYIASTIPLPVRWIRTGVESIKSVRKLLADGYGVISHCSVSSNQYEYPIRVKGVSTYARGNFRAILAGAELSHGLENDTIRNIGLSSVYKCDSPLSECITQWYAARLSARQSGRRSEEAFWKSLLVALIGKFAQTKQKWQEMRSTTSPAAWSTWYSVDLVRGVKSWYRCIGGQVYRRLPPEEGTHSVVALTSYVTSAGRIYLDRLKSIAGSREVYYEDVDSLHTSNRGLSNLARMYRISPCQLGMVKHVQTACGANYVGVRNYSLDTRRVHSGISARATPRTYTEFVDIRRLVVPDPDFPMLPAQWRERQVDIRMLHDRYRGRVDSDGWVQPLVISDP